MNDKLLEREGGKALRKYFAESEIGVHRVAVRRRNGPHRPDAELDIRLPGGDLKRLVVEFKANARRAPLTLAIAQLRRYIAQRQFGDALLLVFSSHLGRAVRKWLRSQNVWFADLSGNQFFRAPGLLVDREVADRASDVSESPGGVFADRNSLLLRYLLERPPIKVGVRELARILGISPAAVSNSLRALEQMGRLERSDRLRLLDREDLLEEWIAFYRPRFRKQAELRRYVHARDAEALIAMLRSHQEVARLPGYGLSLHAGATLVEPYVQFREVHLYVSADSDRLQAELLSALDAQAPAGESNLVLISPFYKDSVLYGSRVVRGVRVVSDLQLYLDLSCFPQRGREQAEVILERRLRPGWSAK